MTTCKHFYEITITMTGPGMAPVKKPTPKCGMLEALDFRDKARKLDVLHEMTMRGGACVDTTACRFQGRATCPYYET
jgi:hypothetical protein